MLLTALSLLLGFFLSSTSAAPAANFKPITITPPHISITITPPHISITKPTITIPPIPTTKIPLPTGIKLPPIPPIPSLPPFPLEKRDPNPDPNKNKPTTTKPPHLGPTGISLPSITLSIPPLSIPPFSIPPFSVPPIHPHAKRDPRPDPNFPTITKPIFPGTGLPLPSITLSIPPISIPPLSFPPLHPHSKREPEPDPNKPTITKPPHFPFPTGISFPPIPSITLSIPPLSIPPFSIPPFHPHQKRDPEAEPAPAPEPEPEPEPEPVPQPAAEALRGPYMMARAPPQPLMLED